MSFDLKQTGSKPISRKPIKSIPKAQKRSPDLKITIVGPTDTTGTSKLYTDLSKLRAENGVATLAGTANFTLNARSLRAPVS